MKQFPKAPEQFFSEAATISSQDALRLMDWVEELEETFMVYRCAIREISTKLEVLSDEFQSKRKRNPIEYIKSRVKNAKSIADKLAKGGYELSVASARQHLTDIAGVRVVCSYVSDIYAVADLLCKQDDINVLETEDYIKSPKDSGYRSLHLVVEVPVFFALHTEPVRVEIQIRTIAMDFWASLEHRLHYKTRNNAPDEIVTELRDCADVISLTDRRMEEIHHLLEHMEEGRDGTKI